MESEILKRSTDYQKDWDSEQGELTKFVQQISEAVQSHFCWLHNVNNEFICHHHSSNLDFSELAHTNCQLGQWYDQCVLPRSLPSQARILFRELGLVHWSLHAQANKIYHSLKQTNAIADGEYIRFSMISVQLFKMLELMRNVIDYDLLVLDPLTGAYARRVMIDDINACIRYCHAQKISTALVMADLDHFKSVNDQFGHLVGDQVLKHFVQCCREYIRQPDTIYRFGGEEFVLLFHATEYEDAVKILDRLRDHFKQSPYIDGNDGPIPVTATFGIAPLGNFRTADHALEAVDQTMYLGKQNGRDRIVRFVE